MLKLTPPPSRLGSVGRSQPASWRELDELLDAAAYLLPHDISGLHDAARGQSVVTGQQDGLLQCHTEGAAVAKQKEKNKKRKVKRSLHNLLI